MPVRKRISVGVLIGVIISLTAIILVIRWAGWADLLLALRSVRWPYVGAAVLVFLISMLARALSWRSLLEYRYPLMRVLAVLNEGYLINNILPWRLGEIGRSVLLAGSKGDSIVRILSSILVERMYDLFFALIFLVLLIPEAAGLADLTQNAAFIGVFLAVAFTFMVLFVRRPCWMQAIITRIPGPRARLLSLWQQMQTGLVALQDFGIFSRSLGWMLLSWILAGFEYGLVLRAVIPDAPLH
ncbi:MAG: flippase-like domain-containing protein, partial [Anaerolineales bacterium]